MAKYMIMARYSRDAMTSMFKEDTDREAAAKVAVEEAGGTLLAFYGMIGQEHNVCIIIEVPGIAEYVGSIGPAISSGTLESWKTIPLADSAEMRKGMDISRRVAGKYKPPGA